MQVPNSKNGRLLKMLIKAEPKMAKISKYQVKYIEKSGKQLSKMFQKDPLLIVAFDKIALFACQNPPRALRYAKLKGLYILEFANCAKNPTKWTPLPPIEVFM